MVQVQFEQEQSLKAQAFEVLSGVGAAQTPQELLDALKQVPLIKNATHTLIILFEGTSAAAQSAAVVAALNNQSADQSWVGYTYNPSVAPWLWHAETNTPFLVDNVQTDSRLQETAAEPWLEPAMQSIVAAALVASEEHLGWLVLTHTMPEAFSTANAYFLQLLAPYLAAALQQQTYVQQAQKSLANVKKMFNIAQKLGGVVEAAEVYQIMAQAFVSAGANTCILATYLDVDSAALPQHGKIVAVTQKTDASRQNNAQALEGTTQTLADFPLLSVALTSGEPETFINIAATPNLSAAERDYFHQLGIQAALIVPLVERINGKPVGYLTLEYPHQQPPSPDELTFIRDLAQQTVRTIAHAQQIANTRRRARQLQTGAEISKITSRILDEEQLIARAVTLIKEGFDLYYVGLFLVDDTNEWAVLRAGTGAEGKEQIQANHRLSIAGEDSMIGWAIARRQARIALDVGQDAVRFDNPYLPHTRSEMALPLVSREQVIGAITIQSTQRAAFSEDDSASLQIMADQLANAILNSRLYHNIQQSTAELNTLLEINRDISASTNLQDLLDLIITKATTIVNGDQGTIFLLQGDTLIPKSVVGGYTEEMLAVRPRVGDGVSGTAAQTRQAVSHLFAAPDQGVQVPGTPAVPEAVVAVPIQNDKEVIGVLLIRRINIVRPFSTTEIKLLEGMAVQAAIAWRNLHLLASVEQSYHREQIIRQLTAKIHAASSVENILQTTVTELSKALNAPGGVIRLAPKKPE